jgi:hypothetical protein
VQELRRASAHGAGKPQPGHPGDAAYFFRGDNGCGYPGQQDMRELSENGTEESVLLRSRIFNTQDLHLQFYFNSSRMAMPIFSST